MFTFIEPNPRTDLVTNVSSIRSNEKADVFSISVADWSPDIEPNILWRPPYPSSECEPDVASEHQSHVYSDLYKWCPHSSSDGCPLRLTYHGSFRSTDVSRRISHTRSYHLPVCLAL